MKAIAVVLLAAMSLAGYDKPDLAGMSNPRPVFKPEPKYTEEAREAKVEGSVLAKVYIDTDGTISQVEILQPLGFGLDLAAMEALAQWKFEPAKRYSNGEAVGVWASVEINFRLL